MKDHRYPLVYPPPPPPDPAVKKRVKKWKPKGPFRFFDLPAELRSRVLEHILLIPGTIDLDPTNHRRIGRYLQLFQASRQLHEEAYPIFYGKNIFRLFPIHRDFFTTKEIILTRLPLHYRAAITCLEFRIGPGWADPPQCWTLGYGLAAGKKKDKSGLEDCVSLRRIKVFVEVDPSHPVFEGFRISEDFYTVFCGELLKRALVLAPCLESIEFDGYESVPFDDPLMTELLSKARAANKRIKFGPERQWGTCKISTPRTPTAPMPIKGLENALAAISLQA